MDTSLTTDETTKPSRGDSFVDLPSNHLNANHVDAERLRAELGVPSVTLPFKSDLLSVRPLPLTAVLTKVFTDDDSNDEDDEAGFERIKTKTPSPVQFLKNSVLTQDISGYREKLERLSPYQLMREVQLLDAKVQSIYQGENGFSLNYFSHLFSLLVALDCLIEANSKPPFSGNRNSAEIIALRNRRSLCFFDLIKNTYASSGMVHDTSVLRILSSECHDYSLEQMVEEYNKVRGEINSLDSKAAAIENKRRLQEIEANGKTSAAILKQGFNTHSAVNRFMFAELTVSCDLLTWQDEYIPADKRESVRQFLGPPYAYTLSTAPDLLFSEIDLQRLESPETLPKTISKMVAVLKPMEFNEIVGRLQSMSLALKEALTKEDSATAEIIAFNAALLFEAGFYRLVQDNCPLHWDPSDLQTLTGIDYTTLAAVLCERLPESVISPAARQGIVDGAPLLLLMDWETAAGLPVTFSPLIKQEPEPTTESAVTTQRPNTAHRHIVSGIFSTVIGAGLASIVLPFFRTPATTASFDATIAKQTIAITTPEKPVNSIRFEQGQPILQPATLRTPPITDFAPLLHQDRLPESIELFQLPALSQALATRRGEVFANNQLNRLFQNAAIGAAVGLGFFGLSFIRSNGARQKN